MPSLYDKRDLVVDRLVGVEGQPVQEVQDHRPIVPKVPRQRHKERWRQEANQQRIVAPVVALYKHTIKQLALCID